MKIVFKNIIERNSYSFIYYTKKIMNKMAKKENKKIKQKNNKKMRKEKFRIIKSFNWGWFKFIKCIFGIFIFSLAINLFVVPNNLYTGGILGLSQLIRTGLNSIFDLNVSFDISSIIYYIINIPLFFVAFKRISKTFFVRTIFSITLNSIFLLVIPIPAKPLISDLLGNILIGGSLAGIGIGMALSTGSSTGGTDIIGIILSKKNNKLTVGNIGLVFNILVYSICGIKYGIEIMIYSIIYAIFETIMIDKNHTQNICSEAFIFTKKNPEKMIRFINFELKRGATYWEAVGGYTNTKTYIVYTVLSKYERMRLGRHMKEFDEKAFMVGDDGVEIKGLFDKYFI